MSVADSQAGFACDLDIVTLFCADNKTINISSAHFGVYANECTTSCCAASSGDCTESLETTAPIYWESLLETCQNQTFCQFEHPGRSLASCEPNVSSDYIVVTYTCSPGTKLNDQSVQYSRKTLSATGSLNEHACVRVDLKSM